MTKKIFLGMSAMAMLFATSCKDDFAESFVGDQATVEFSISTPEIGTRAYSDGATATNLQYAVYEVQGEGVTKTLTYLDELTVTDATINGSTTVKLELTTGESYAVIFWAAAEDAPYTVDFEDMEMTVDYTNAVSNDESRDAFYKYHEFTVSGAQTETIELRRPFAQLNIGTSDYTNADKAGYVPNQSYVKVPVYSTLNLSTGEVEGQATTVFAYNDIPTGETFPVAGYQYLAMNYLLVDAEQEVVDIEFGYEGANDAEHTRQVGSVPVQRNYRTNIYGKLLTSTVDVNVEIKPEYNEPDYNNKYEVSTASQLQDAIYDAVAAGNGIITLTANITANEIITIGTNTRSNADAQIVIEGNGKTLTSTAGRAINVSGVNGVIIKNLTINASGERAINIIQNATNVTIENVTATAANYTVNVAASAPNAVVAINNSTLNGLCTVNVSTAGANVTVDKSTINCNDNNTTAGEAYAALSLNKDAVGGKIIATNTSVNVTEGSDSVKGRNGAKDGEVTINGSTNGVVTMVACITYEGSDYYHAFATLQAAIDFAKDGETITLIRDIEFNENAYYNNSGWRDGLGYAGDKSFTIDLNDYTIGQNGFLNDYLLWFKNVGSKANTITIKNGTLDAGTTAYCALCTASSHDNTLTVNLEDVTLINNISNGSTVKVRAGSVLNVNAGTKIIGKNSYLGIENWNAEVNVYDGAEIYMNGTASYNGCLIGVGGNGTINVYGGYGKGVSGGLIAMTSGGTINVSGGEWIANTDGTYANSNKSVLIAQSDKQYNAGAGNAVVNVTGGTFKGGYNCYGNAVGDAQINISGGNFNADPTSYVVDDKTATEENGTWTVK